MMVAGSPGCQGWPGPWGPGWGEAKAVQLVTLDSNPDPGSAPVPCWPGPPTGLLSQRTSWLPHPSRLSPGMSSVPPPPRREVPCWAWLPGEAHIVGGSLTRAGTETEPRQWGCFFDFLSLQEGLADAASVCTQVCAHTSKGLGLSGSLLVSLSLCLSRSLCLSLPISVQHVL